MVLNLSQKQYSTASSESPRLETTENPMNFGTTLRWMLRFSQASMNGPFNFLCSLSTWSFAHMVVLRGYILLVIYCRLFSVIVITIFLQEHFKILRYFTRCIIMQILCSKHLLQPNNLGAPTLCFWGTNVTTEIPTVECWTIEELNDCMRRMIVAQVWCQWCGLVCAILLNYYYYYRHNNDIIIIIF